MANPSDLVSNYSSHVFNTRLSALIFSGAVLGTALTWDKEMSRSDLVGSVLIVAVVSLGELNRRYTHAFWIACYASSLSLSSVREQEEKERIRWALFATLNEYPWSPRANSLYVPMSRTAGRITLLRAWLLRFLLSWLTFVPGLLLGVGLIIYGSISRGVFSAWGISGLVVGACVLVWWIYLSRFNLGPENLEQRKEELLNEEYKSP